MNYKTIFEELENNPKEAIEWIDNDPILGNIMDDKVFRGEKPFPWNPGYKYGGFILIESVGIKWQAGVLKTPERHEKLLLARDAGLVTISYSGSKTKFRITKKIGDLEIAVMNAVNRISTTE